MNQQIQPLQLDEVTSTAAPTLPQVTAQSFATVMSVVMAVWVGTFVLQQVIKVFKGEEIEKPPLLIGQ